MFLERQAMAVLAFFVPLVVLVIAYIVIYLIRPAIKERRKLIAISEENLRLLNESIANLVQAKNNYSLYHSRVRLLESISPREAWGEFVDRANISVRNYNSRIHELIQLEGSDSLLAEAEKRQRLYKECLRFSKYYASLLEDINLRVEEFNSAKRLSEKLIDSLPDLLKGDEVKAAHPDVSPKTKEMFNEVKLKYEEAVRPIISSSSLPNWINILSDLTSVFDLLKSVEMSIAKDMDSAKKLAPPTSGGFGAGSELGKKW